MVPADHRVLANGPLAALGADGDLLWPVTPEQRQHHFPNRQG